MGNVLAASQQSIGLGNPPPPAFTNLPSPTPGSENDKKPPMEPLDNPGTLEDLHKKCKGILFDRIDCAF